MQTQTERTFKERCNIRRALDLVIMAGKVPPYYEPKHEKPMSVSIDPAKVFESVGGVEQFITETNVIPSPDKPQ